MRQLWTFVCLLVLAAVPMLAATPHVTTIPPGAESVSPERLLMQEPCEVTIRYDDGTDDLPDGGSSLGGGQRLGIIAQAPTADPGYVWEIYGVRFYAEFWLTPGDLDIQLASISDPSNTTTETVSVTGGGTWEFEMTNPLLVGSQEEFSVMLCPLGATEGVTGEDTSSPDGRSYWSGSGCKPDRTDFDSPRDLMIWVCARQVGAQETAVPATGGVSLAVLALLVAGLGAYWALGRRGA